MDTATGVWVYTNLTRITLRPAGSEFLDYEHPAMIACRAGEAVRMCKDYWESEREAGFFLIFRMWVCHDKSRI